MRDETCQRCGEVGGDRRTLWMACLYEMDELYVPFKKQTLQTVPVGDTLARVEMVPWASTQHNSDGSKTVRSGETERKYLTAITGTRTDPRLFYTLLVCKDCRAEWLAAIKIWFTYEKRVGGR